MVYNYCGDGMDNKKDMFDIDLRFTKKQVPVPECGENITKQATILQWRKRINGIWSEWVDVELVEYNEENNIPISGNRMFSRRGCFVR